MRRSLVTVTTGLAVAGSLVACGSKGDSSGGASAPTVTLTAVYTQYAPAEISLPAGKRATIKLDNRDNIEHNLTVEQLEIDKDVEGKKAVSVTVTAKAGTYQFHCEYHPQQMKGTITVT